MLYATRALRAEPTLDELSVLSLGLLSLVMIVSAIRYRAWQLSPESAGACG